jgi:WD40 repeat protein
MISPRVSWKISAYVAGLAFISLCSLRYALAGVPLTTPTAPQPEVLAAHTGDIHGLAFSPDGKTIASGGNDGLIKLWDVSSRKLKKTLFPRGGDVWELQFSPDGKTLIVALEDGLNPKPKPKSSLDESLYIALWDMQTQKIKRSFPVRGTEFTGFALSPDAKLAAVCSDSFEHGRQATLWEIRTGKLLREMDTEQDGPFEVAFAPDNETVAVGTLFQKLRLWDAPTGKVKVLGDSDAMLKFSSDGKFLVGMDEGTGIAIRNATTGRLVRSLEGHGDTVWSFAFSPDVRTLASGGGDLNSEIILWNMADGKQITAFKGHIKGVTSLAYSPDGRILVSGGADGTLRFWKLK